jgi:hypothetical protein
MESITSASELQKAIRETEEKHVMQGQLLKEQFNLTVEKLKPSNLFKSIKLDISSTGILKSLLGGTLGLTAGYLSKKLITRSSKGQFKGILGNLVQVGITGLIAKYSSVFKTIGTSLLQQMLKRKRAY